MSGALPLPLRGELARKVLHMTWVLVPVAYALGLSRVVILSFLIGAVTLAIAVELARTLSARIRLQFQTRAGGLLRAHEHDRWSGATWLLISFLLLVFLFEAPIAITGMWAVAVGDAAAAVLGRTVGRTRFGHSRKTLEGSIACAVTTAGGAFFVAGLTPGLSVISGLIAAGAEWPAVPGDDNIRIGLAVGTGILLCHMAFS
jgi:dolichol kinase